MPAVNAVPILLPVYWYRYGFIIRGLRGFAPDGRQDP